MGTLGRQKSPVQKVQDSGQPPGHGQLTLLKALLCLAVFSVAIAALCVFDVRACSWRLFTWMREHKAEGFVVFVCVFVVATVLLLPGVVLSLGAGAVFGLPLGLLAVWIGATLGETVAFLLGRFLFREWMADVTKRYEWWAAVEHAIEHEGWKIVLLLRLTPLVPFNLLNYALGMTAVKFWDYSWSSSLGVLPGMAFFIYLGSLATDLALVANGKAASFNTTTTLLTAVASGVMVTFTMVVTGMWAKRAIKQKLEQEQAAIVDASQHISLDMGYSTGLREALIMQQSTARSYAQ